MCTSFEQNKAKMWTYKTEHVFFFQLLEHTATKFTLLGIGKLISLVGENHDSVLL